MLLASITPRTIHFSVSKQGECYRCTEPDMTWPLAIGGVMSELIAAGVNELSKRDEVMRASGRTDTKETGLEDRS